MRRHRTSQAAPPRTAGFTLFEIAISLAIVAVCVLSLLLLFPAGIKTQQLARFRVLAAAKMLEMCDVFNTASSANPSMDHEGPQPWDVTVGYRSRAFDLESIVAAHRNGIAPLPLTIARRLDSDGDEIAGILDEGGYVYYSHPQLSGGFDESHLPPAPGTEAQRLVFAVTGYAQENALLSLPMKSWPYYAPYPSPPIHVHHWPEFSPPWNPPMPASNERFGAQEFDDIACYLWEATDDPDVQVVFQWPAAGDADPAKNYGYLPYAYPATPYALPATRSGGARGAPTADAALRYVQAAVWYCQRTMPGATDWWRGTAPQDDFAPGVEPSVQVRALRFMAHAAICLTRWHPQSDLRAGIVIDDPGAFPSPSTSVTLTEENILNLHRTCLQLADRFAASFPYDWGTPRPAERAIMMDQPLLQWDLFADVNAPLVGVITGDGAAATQWRPIAGSPVVHTGRSMSYPGQDLDAAWGADNRHFSLTAHFAPCERARQVVFWAVDWQSYSDFETAPSAPMDASRYPKGAPRLMPGGQEDLPAMMANHPWIDAELWNYRNPEKAYSFFVPRGSTQDPRDLPTGSDMTAMLLGPTLGDGDWGSVADKGLQRGSTDPHAPQMAFNGVFGADRNLNHRLDRGPLPPSARLRAVLVARYDFYDPRVNLCLR